MNVILGVSAISILFIVLIIVMNYIDKQKRNEDMIILRCEFEGKLEEVIEVVNDIIKEKEKKSK
jgi:hypothetical protein